MTQTLRKDDGGIRKYSNIGTCLKCGDIKKRRARSQFCERCFQIVLMQKVREEDQDGQ